jgi:hypothetical protein
MTAKDRHTEADFEIKVSEYTPIMTTNLSGWQITLAENKDKREPFLVEWRREPDLGIPNDSYFCGVTADYIEAVTEFTEHLRMCLGVARSNRESKKSLHDVHYMELSPDDCLPDSRNSVFTGKLLIVRAGELKPEYRTADSQLVICSHGNGARPDAIGTSVFGNELFSGDVVCYRRHQIEGVADPDKLPGWAKSKWKDYEAARPQPERKPTLQEKLSEAKEKAAQESAKKPVRENIRTKRKRLGV